MSADSPVASKIGRLELLAIVLMLASHFPFLFVRYRNLWWSSPHYHFFPAVLLGIAWLVWRRWPSAGCVGSRPRLTTAFLLGGLAMLAADVSVSSTWPATVAFVLTTAGVMLAVWGANAWRDWLPVWALLWLLVPLPFGWDQEFIRWLQSLTSRAGSSVLDVLGVLHLMEGNVVVLPGHRLLVAEACSGVNSVFTLLAATALFVVFARRPLVRSVLLLVASACWAGVANLVRIVTVALVQSRFGVDLSSGWQHEVLGLTTLALALLMLASTDRLLAFFLGPIEFNEAESDVLEPIESGEAKPEVNPLSGAWNWCVGGSDSNAAPILAERACAQTAPHGGGGKAVTRIWDGLIVAGFLTLAVLQLVALDFAPFQRTEPAFPERFHREGLFIRSDLPATVAGWTQVEYTEDPRDQTRELGVFRQVWAYRLDDRRQCFVAAAYPFVGWHDLTICYANQGWNILDCVQRQGGSTPALELGPFVDVEMVRPDGERGYLLFSDADQAGDLEHPSNLPVTWRRIAQRLVDGPLLGGLVPKDLRHRLDVRFKVQVITSSVRPLSGEDREAFQKLFLAVRQQLLSVYKTRYCQVDDE